MSIKTALKTFAALTAAALPGVVAWLVAPGRLSKERREPFAGRTYAHRGLYRKDQLIPENSLPAFARAAEAGYGIELDLQLTKDDRVVVFHDDTLLRGCGVDRPLSDLTFEELQALQLFGTCERIPLFSDVLALVKGRVPLIVEFKTSGSRNDRLCALACELLDAYEGLYMVESFDPRIVRWFRLHRPSVIRGQLACRPESYKKGTPFPVPLIFGYCLANFMGRPQFIAYALEKKPFTVRLAELLGAMKVCWTSHNPYMHKGQDVVIFEFYRPDLRL